MKKSALIFVVLFSFVLFSSPVNSTENKNIKSSDIAEQFISIVTQILQGGEFTALRDNVSPEAYLISNNFYESIFEVLDNPSKSKNFLEGKDAEVRFLRLLMSDEKNAYMVLQTKSNNNTTTNWHTILFRMGENNKWQILNWHKS